MLNGYEAIVEALNKLWGVKDFPIMDFMPGKPPYTEPIRIIAWHVRANPRRHLHVVTLGLSELQQKETADPGRSGFGLELSLRLALDIDDELPEQPYGSAATLQALGRAFFGSRRSLNFDDQVPCSTVYSADFPVTGLRWSDLAFDRKAVDAEGDGHFTKAVLGTEAFDFLRLAPGVAGQATGLVFDTDPELEPIECATGRIGFWSVLGYRLHEDDSGTDVVERTRAHFVGAIHPRNVDEWKLPTAGTDTAAART